MRLVSGWAYPESDQFMAAEMSPFGTYQLSHLEAALPYVTDWRCAVDGGAHVGLWSLQLAKRFETVIAVEPCPETQEALRWNLSRHGASHVRVKPVALGAEAGSVSLAMDAKNRARANSGAWYVQDGGDIPRETVDSWLLPALGFLKLDVEGSEPFALDGARETLIRCRPIVLFENKGFWSRYGLPHEAPQRLLLDLGYQHLRTVGCDEIWGPR